LWHRLSVGLAPSGFFSLGGAETVLGISDKFHAAADNRGIYCPASLTQPQRLAAGDSGRGSAFKKKGRVFRPTLASSSRMLFRRATPWRACAPPRPVPGRAARSRG